MIVDVVADVRESVSKLYHSITTRRDLSPTSRKVRLRFVAADRPARNLRGSFGRWEPSGHVATVCVDDRP